MSGEIDYIEQPPADLIPILSANDEIVIQNISPLGYQTMGRMNFLHPPFDNVKVRQAALMAMNQKDVLDALIGNPEYYKTCPAIFGCGTPLASDAGAKSLVSGGNAEAAKKLLQEAGYDGKPVVIMQPTDVNTLKAQPIVAAQLLRKAGFTVDLQAMDWQTLVTRRASQKAPAEGGWNMFFTNWIVPEIFNPLVNPMLNGRGTKGAWFGWPDDPKMEQMRDAYAAAKSADEQKKIADEIQAHAMETVNYIPLGQYVTPIARRKELAGVLNAPVPFFWNVEKKKGK
jgi:peptide/nickel transport system substrate-binding protein